MSNFNKVLYGIPALIGLYIFVPFVQDVLIPLGNDVIKNSGVFKNLTVSEKEEMATNSYEVVKEQPKDYSKNYEQAHNKIDCAETN